MEKLFNIFGEFRKSCGGVAGFCLVLYLFVTPAVAQDQIQSVPTVRSEKPAESPASPSLQPDDQPAPTLPAQTNDVSAEDDPPTMFPRPRDTRFWLSGQINFIYQTHPEFPAAFSGANSLSPGYEKALSRVLTLYGGVRLNNSTEILGAVEEAGGSGLSTGLGLAGNTNLDIVRNPLLSKAPYLARGMIHKVFALSEEKIENQRTQFSLFDELPRRRLEIRFGKFSLPDFLDLNSAGSDTHFQFTNWTVDNNGAWDYAADTRGYTIALAADFETRNWGIRFASGLMPKVANGIDLLWQPWRARGDNFEVELRRGLLPKKSGAVRLLAFTNSANMGIYRNAIADFLNGKTRVPDITNHPFRITRKYGFGVNVEQELARNITAFGRFGWDNGKTESFAYTEVDQTVLGGVGVSGALWRRKNDRAGVAFVSNGISKDHQKYLALGGLGFLLGDGGLIYGREKIVETYYTVHVWRGLYLAPGGQYIVNPGYNRARGPVVVGALRGHVEF